MVFNAKELEKVVDSVKVDGLNVFVQDIDKQIQLEEQGIYTLPQGMFMWTGSIWTKVAGV